MQEPFHQFPQFLRLRKRNFPNFDRTEEAFDQNHRSVHVSPEEIAGTKRKWGDFQNILEEPGLPRKAKTWSNSVDVFCWKQDPLCFDLVLLHQRSNYPVQTSAWRITRGQPKKMFSWKKKNKIMELTATTQVLTRTCNSRLHRSPPDWGWIKNSHHFHEIECGVR